MTDRHRSSSGRASRADTSGAYDLARRSFERRHARVGGSLGGAVHSPGEERVRGRPGRTSRTAGLANKSVRLTCSRVASRTSERTVRFSRPASTRCKYCTVMSASSAKRSCVSPRAERNSATRRPRSRSTSSALTAAIGSDVRGRRQEKPKLGRLGLSIVACGVTGALARQPAIRHPVAVRRPWVPALLRPSLVSSFLGGGASAVERLSPWMCTSWPSTSSAFDTLIDTAPLRARGAGEPVFTSMTADSASSSGTLDLVASTSSDTSARGMAAGRRGASCLRSSPVICGGRGPSWVERSPVIPCVRYDVCLVEPADAGTRVWHRPRYSSSISWLTTMRRTSLCSHGSRDSTARAASSWSSSLRLAYLAPTRWPTSPPRSTSSSRAFA